MPFPTDSSSVTALARASCYEKGSAKFRSSILCVPDQCPAICSSRSIRSSIGGWVENRFAMPPAAKGFTMNM